MVCLLSLANKTRRFFLSLSFLLLYLDWRLLLVRLDVYTRI